MRSFFSKLWERENPASTVSFTPPPPEPRKTKEFIPDRVTIKRDPRLLHLLPWQAEIEDSRRGFHVEVMVNSDEVNLLAGRQMQDQMDVINLTGATARSYKNMKLVAEFDAGFISDYEVEIGNDSGTRDTQVRLGLRFDLANVVLKFKGDE